MNIFQGAPWTLSDEKARNELKKFLIAGWAIALVALVAFGWAAGISVAFGARCIILSWQKANAKRPNGMWLKVGSISLVLLSLFELIAVWAVRK